MYLLTNSNAHSLPICLKIHRCKQRLNAILQSNKQYKFPFFKKDVDYTLFLQVTCISYRLNTFTTDKKLNMCRYSSIYPIQTYCHKWLKVTYACP